MPVDLYPEREEDAVVNSNEPLTRAKLEALHNLQLRCLSASDLLAAIALAGVLDAAIRCLYSHCFCAFDFGAAIVGGSANGNALRSLQLRCLSASDFLAAITCAGVLDAAIRCLYSRCFCAFDFGAAIVGGSAKGVVDVDVAASCASVSTLLLEGSGRSMRSIGSSGWSAMV